MLGVPTPADPEIAAATFRQHLDELWASGRPELLGWRRITLDDLHEVVELPAHRTNGQKDSYFVKLGAEFYDLYPPMTNFVVPDTWTDSTDGTRWYPKINAPGWFGLHNAYGYLDGQSRQLVCFTLAAQYYQTSHAPPESTVWRQGRHTVAATLNRLAEVLSPPYYQEPSG